MSDSLADYRATMKKREARARREQEERREQARATAWHVARYLRDTYGVSCVVLFGSMAQEVPLSRHSDLDLAVWGLDAEDYFEAVGRMQGEGTPFSVDLVRMEQAPDSLCAVVQEEGRELLVHESR
jgi:predicted nucleotidyltransferase